MRCTHAAGAGAAPPSPAPTVEHATLQQQQPCAAGHPVLLALVCDWCAAWAPHAGGSPGSASPHPHAVARLGELHLGLPPQQPQIQQAAVHAARVHDQGGWVGGWVGVRRCAAPWSCWGQEEGVGQGVLQSCVGPSRPPGMLVPMALVFQHTGGPQPAPFPAWVGRAHAGLRFACAPSPASGHKLLLPTRCVIYTHPCLRLRLTAARLQTGTDEAYQPKGTWTQGQRKRNWVKYEAWSPPKQEEGKAS